MSQKSNATHPDNNITAPALTPWFPGDVNPVHIGLYQVVVGDSLALTLFPRGNFLHWDGLAWRAPTRNLIIQTGNPYVIEVPLSAIIRWRGLAEDPNKTAETIAKNLDPCKKQRNELEFALRLNLFTSAILELTKILNAENSKLHAYSSECCHSFQFKVGSHSIGK